MFGALLAARFIGKKPWGVSAIFWAILLAIGLGLGALGIAQYFIVSLIIGFIIFLAVAWFYLKIHPLPLGIIMYIVSWVINIAIGFILGAIGWNVSLI